MVRPPKEFLAAAEKYVCVRVVNMAGVDLNTYRFDYDLTFAALLMNADGTTYHRFGGRDWTDASARLTIEGLVRLMKDSLSDHEEYQRHPSPPREKPRRILEEIPPMARRLKKQKIECLHCHMVNGAERELAQEEKRWSAEEIWMWPLPERVGVKLDRSDPALVKEVVSDSAASKSGVRAGDRLRFANGARIRSEADLQWVLTHSGDDSTVKFEIDRNGKSESASLVLAKKWKVGDPLEVSWRPYMWGLRPQPGFGGPMLNEKELAKIGLKSDEFAFRVNYIVTWGDEPQYGQSAANGGIKKDDIVLSAGGKSDFKSERHFQTWFRLTQKPGQEIEYEILRAGKRSKLKVSIPD